MSDRSLARFDLNIPKLFPRYGIHTAREAHDWFRRMMREHEEFEVKTDEPGEWPVPFWSETVRRVMVESHRLALSPREPEESRESQ